MPESLHSRTRSIDAEMHELNQEADYLEEKTHVVSGLNGTDTKLQRQNNDPDAQAMVIESLRSQIQDLFSQVSQLNNKLVRSYDRMSDLEDELHVSQTNLRTSTLKISELEFERSQHLSALSTGLLVEKDHVTTELNRLMEKATEEAAQRGQAETARLAIERDLDDLSASLFNQANSMVAEARIAEARSERKAQETERALKETEEVVGLLQEQMQALQAEKEDAVRAAEEMRITMGKGKWVERTPERLHQATRPRLLCSHLPYQEYLTFIAHLRSIRPATQHPPAMSALLTLPFLARLNTEDSDPTIRLDLAPSLNWLTRRSVISAIHSGQLTVEPMSTLNLLEELNPSAIPGYSPHPQVSCALCGTLILPTINTESTATTPIASPPVPHKHNINNSWSSSLFKTSFVHAMSTPTSQAHSPLPPFEPPTQVYIFRISATSTGLPVPLPLASQQNGSQNRPTIYPLCTSKWCLARLRTTCSMWAFVRTGLVEKIWEESAYIPPPRSAPSPTTNGVNGAEKHVNGNGTMDDKKPPIPPRRARMAIGALWGSMQRTLSSSGKDLEAETMTVKEKEEVTKPLPKSPTVKSPLPPPPVHPYIASPRTQPSAVPPPLPKRNRGRDVQAKSVSPAPTDNTDGTAALVAPSAESPPLSRIVTPDDFTTPPEEPAYFIATRPMSPSTVPLPPSVPPTPPPPSLPPRTTQPTAEQSMPTTPTTPVSGVASTIIQKVSSRSGSPVPPPIPRRAAARARPISIVAPPPSVPVADETLAAEVAAESNIASVVPEKVHDVQPVTEIAAQRESGDAAQPQQSLEQAPADIATAPEAKSTTNGDSVLVPTEPAESSSDLAPNHSAEETAMESPQAQEVTATAETVDTQEAALAVASDEAAGLQVPEHSDNEAPSPVAPPTNGVVDGVEGQCSEKQVNAVTNGSSDSAKGEFDDPEETELDSGMYVGDATWEERTWTELVRLRETMYRARIGVRGT